MFPSFTSFRHLRRYREIAKIFLAHGFGFVFNRLEPEWRSLRHLLQRRSSKISGSAPENLSMHFRLALEELGPTFIKFGQILSTRPDLLPPEYIRELSRLQDTVAPLPWEIMQPVIEQELGKSIKESFSIVDPQPLASASLAQVYAATLLSGEEVVIKVQRPNITDIISVDLEILTSWARRAQATPLGRVYDFISMVDDFAFTLRNELDYSREGRNADRFRLNFANEKFLYIPKVYWESSTSRVLIIERIKGIKIDNIKALDEAGYDRKRIATNGARIIIKEVLEDGFFHADMHPGNFIVMPGEIVGAMDFGMVGYLRDKDRMDLIRLYAVSVRLDSDSMVEQFIRMGATNVEVDRKALARDIDRLLDKYHNMSLKEIRAKEVIEETMSIAFHHHLRLPPDMWLLGKTLAMTEGIGIQLDPDFNVFAFSEPYVKKLTWSMLKPNRKWLDAILNAGVEWGEFINAVPRTGLRTLKRMERGDPVPIVLEVTNRVKHSLDRLFARLTLGILLAAFIIGLAFLIPGTAPGSWAQLIVLVGFIVVVILGIGLLVSIFRER